MSVSAATYQEIQHFYARQMQALDAGDAVAFARTFEPDGVFDANGLPEPVRGRELIESGAREAADQLRADGIQTRHWLGMLAVEDRPDGTLLATTNALVFRTPRGSQPALTASTSCADLLVRDGDTLAIRYRTVRRDDLEA